MDGGRLTEEAGILPHVPCLLLISPISSPGTSVGRNIPSHFQPYSPAAWPGLLGPLQPLCAESFSGGSSLVGIHSPAA